MRKCAQCGKPLTSTRSNARYCSASCRGRATKVRKSGAQPAADQVVELPAGEGGRMLAATVAELTAAERLKTPHGAAAVALAERIDRAVLDTGSAYAALVREWRATLAEATRGAVAKADALDELAARRQRRVAG